MSCGAYVPFDGGKWCIFNVGQVGPHEFPSTDYCQREFRIAERTTVWSCVRAANHEGPCRNVKGQEPVVGAWDSLPSRGRSNRRERR